MKVKYNLDDIDIDEDRLEDLGVDLAFAVATGIVEYLDDNEIGDLSIDYDSRSDAMLVQGDEGTVEEVADYLETL